MEMQINVNTKIIYMDSAVPDIHHMMVSAQDIFWQT